MYSGIRVFSRSVVFLGFIHIVTYISNSFLFINELCYIVGNPPQFICFLTVSRFGLLRIKMLRTSHLLAGYFHLINSGA